jgi:hypothetical protein
MEMSTTSLPFAYERRLTQVPGLSLKAMSDTLMKQGAVYETLEDLAQQLSDVGIPYAVIGAIALSEYGFVRATVDIDLLLTPVGLDEFRNKLVGRGYVLAFPDAQRSFRSASTGVRIDVVVTGEYPGDGNPKPVSFPDPAEASVEREGIHFISMEKLVELKLASGLTAPHRLRDLADVQDLIRSTGLPVEFADKLDESVRDVYRDLWRRAYTVDPLQEQEPG